MSLAFSRVLSDPFDTTKRMTSGKGSEVIDSRGSIEEENKLIGGGNGKACEEGEGLEDKRGPLESFILTSEVFSIIGGSEGSNETSGS